MYKNLKFAVLFLIAVLFSNLSFSQTDIDDFDFTSTKKNKEQANIKLDLKENLLSEKDFKIPNSINDIERKLDEEEEPKSPVVGAMLSAVLPGLGEFYSKSYVRQVPSLLSKQLCGLPIQFFKIRVMTRLHTTRIMQIKTGMSGNMPVG